MTAAIVAVASPFVVGTTISGIDAGTKAMIGAVVLAYLMLALYFHWSDARGASFGPADTIWRVAATFGVVGLLWVLLDWAGVSIVGGDLPHRIFVALLGMAIGGSFVNRALRNRPRTALAVAMTLAVAAALTHVEVGRQASERAIRPAISETFVDTALYQLRVLRFTKFIPDTGTTGGAIERLPSSGYLVASADGDLYRVDVDRDRGLQVRRLAVHVPINTAAFRGDARRVTANTVRADVDPHFFRVADILVRGHGAEIELFATHHYWNTAAQCHVVRVSSIRLSAEQLAPLPAAQGWRVLFESLPCLPLKMGGYRGVRFGGLQIGGRMVLDGASTLLVALGDQEFDGLNSDWAVSQDPTTSYGKVVAISLADGRAETVGSGLRNPQGMFRDSNGTIWATDHGPQGGDEVNILRRDANYGWPVVTYGTEYGTHLWPGNPQQGRHEGFEKPVFAFVPSVGLSALIGIDGGRLALWRGDLIAASLKGHSLYRLHVEAGRIVLAEPIKLGFNLRDVIVGPDGRLVVLTDDNDLILLEPVPGHTGAALLQQCLGCHTVARGETGSLAPNLRRIVGRSVAAADFEYSAALKKAGGEWTVERLDAFLKDPQALAPGNAMAYAGMASARDRDELIRYLATLR